MQDSLFAQIGAGDDQGQHTPRPLAFYVKDRWGVQSRFFILPNGSWKQLYRPRRRKAGGPCQFAGASLLRLDSLLRSQCGLTLLAAVSEARYADAVPDDNFLVWNMGG